MDVTQYQYFQLCKHTLWKTSNLIFIRFIALFIKKTMMNNRKNSDAFKAFVDIFISIFYYSLYK